MKMKHFVIKVLLASAVMLTALMLIAYLLDPLFVYRYRDNGTQWIQPEQTSAGLIKTYDYDTVLLGSSVTQNFNAQAFGDTVGGEVLKVNAGGMSITEMEGYVEWIQTVGKAETVYVCIDLPQFGKDAKTDVDRLKYHIMDNNPFNDYKYLLGFETWMRFIPINTGLALLDAVGMEYPERIQLKTDLDRAGEWAGDYSYSAEIVKSDYQRGINRVTALDPTDLYARMVERIDECLAHFTFDETDFVFYFAPYSALCWSDMQSAGTLDAVIDAKLYLEEKLLGFDHVTVVDFQAMDVICDLNQYRDVSHFGPAVTEQMMFGFRDGTYVIDSMDTGRAVVEQQRALIAMFRDENKDWIK